MQPERGTRWVVAWAAQPPLDLSMGVNGDFVSLILYGSCNRTPASLLRHEWTTFAIERILLPHVTGMQGLRRHTVGEYMLFFCFFQFWDFLLFCFLYMSSFKLMQNKHWKSTFRYLFQCTLSCCACTFHQNYSLYFTQPWSSAVAVILTACNISVERSETRAPDSVF